MPLAEHIPWPYLISSILASISRSLPVKLKIEIGRWWRGTATFVGNLKIKTNKGRWWRGTAILFFFLPLYLLMVLYPGLFDMLKPFRQLDHWSPTNIHGKLIWNSHLETPLFHDHKRYLAPKLVRIIVALSPPDVTYILGPITFNFFRKWSSIFERYELWYLEGTA